MRLVCDVDIDDIIAFNQFYQSHSALGARARRIQRVVFLVLFASAVWMGWQFFSDDLVVVCCIAFGVGGFGFVQFGRKSSLSGQVAKSVRVIYDDPAMKATLGEKTLEIDGDWIVQSSEIFQTRAKISSLHSLHVEGGRVFIRMNPVAAIVIPLGKVAQGDVAAFLDDLRSQCPERLREAIDHGGSALTKSANPYRSSRR